MILKFILIFLLINNVKILTLIIRNLIEKLSVYIFLNYSIYYCNRELVFERN